MMRMLVSCISTRHSLLKNHWAKTSATDTLACPLTTLGSFAKPKEDVGGALCLLEDMKDVQKAIELPMPAGMVASEKGVFVTGFHSIAEADPDLADVQQDVVSLPLFNALHSISRTRRGYLVASTGVDLLVEFNREGEVLWNWWATEHGFALTPAGIPRSLDKAVDYRTIKYGTLQQTTHVNSAAQLADGRILASIFHQGMVIAIDYATGAWQPVLTGLDHPHAVRVLDENHFTVADTVHGKALLVRIDKHEGHVEEEVDAGTDWLQDCQYDSARDCWILVDGKNSRVSLRKGRSGQAPLDHFAFDPEWRLYEAHVLA